MTRGLRHAGAALTRTVRQLWRGRLVVLATIASPLLISPSIAEAQGIDRVIGALAFSLVFAVAITTIGVPGDDIASGAIANDLLAGTPPTALVAGALGAVVVAALPGWLGAGALLSQSPVVAPVGAWGVGVSVAILGAVALAALSLALGVCLPGRNASFFTVLGAIVGFLPPEGIRVSEQSESLNRAAQAAWRALPLPHHVVAAAQQVELGGSVTRPVLHLVIGTLVALCAAVVVLRLRIAGGRWS